tara:strand:- start:747 stop:2144 length:1398 start_codon:yes stop_codon:yes gene_type:complete
MRLREAQLRCPEGVFIEEDPDLYSEHKAEVLHQLSKVSSIVEDDDIETTLMDITGLDRLYGDVRSICNHIRGVLGKYHPYIGVAKGGFAAKVASYNCKPPNWIEIVNCSDRKYLFTEHISILPLSSRVVQQLILLGITTVGEYAFLPINSISARYGTEGIVAHRLAQGIDTAILQPFNTPLVFSETIEFEWCENNFDRVIFHTQELANRIEFQLQSQGLMAQRVCVGIDVDLDVPSEVEFDLPEPSAQARTFLNVVRWHLKTRFDKTLSRCKYEYLTAGGVKGLRLSVEKLIPFEGLRVEMLPSHQYCLQNANQSIGRLRLHLGDDAVFRTQVLPEESRLENAFEHIDSYFSEYDKPNKTKEKESSLIDGRMSTAEVLSCGAGGVLRIIDPPDKVVFQKGKKQHLIIDGEKHEVLQKIGPHRIENLWLEIPVARDYFRFILSGGVGALLYHDLVSDVWYIQGLVD